MKTWSSVVRECGSPIFYIFLFVSFPLFSCRNEDKKENRVGRNSLILQIPLEMIEIIYFFSMTFCFKMNGENTKNVRHYPSSNRRINEFYPKKQIRAPFNTSKNLNKTCWTCQKSKSNNLKNCFFKKNHRL